MTAYGYMRGHRIEYSETEQKWYYADTGKFIDLDHERPCTLCHKLPTPEGYDACLGELPGVLNACCGHGVEDGYIHYEKRPFWLTNKNRWPLAVGLVASVPCLLVTLLFLHYALTCTDCTQATVLAQLLPVWGPLYLIMTAGFMVSRWIQKKQHETGVLIREKIAEALRS